MEGLKLDDLCFLVAEDHEFQRSALVTTLQSLGARTIHQAEDGYSALKILEGAKRVVDIVISDLDMPGMDGMEFVRRLGESGAGISIILASALDRRLLGSIATMAEAYGIRLLGVVEKPLTPEKLKPLLRRHRRHATAPRRRPDPVFALPEILEGLKNDEFEPFLQPKVALTTGEVHGVEALARWRHPKHGVVEPSAFIGVLESGCAINELMWVMLKKTASLCRSWRANGLDITAAVNVSVKSLSDVTMADRVTELVRGQDLEPRHMILEVTESAATSDVGAALENLARLRMKGFGLSIDDYGTGYASMQQLARIAFTELKIDQSFVMKAAEQGSARVILESSINVARELNIISVAEGVETLADFELLRSLRCLMVQGYFIAQPMEASALPAWVEEWKLGLSAPLLLQHGQQRPPPRPGQALEIVLAHARDGEGVGPGTADRRS